MKTLAKMLVAVVLGGGMLSSVMSQVNVNANVINFRSINNPDNTTYHYGDLRLYGEESGTGSSTWGWLWCTKLRVSENKRSPSEIFGNLNIYGSLNLANSKSFIHPHPTDETKVIRYISIESGEALTVTRGNAKTVDGEVTIKLPEHFSLVTSSKEPITVIVTPKGAPVLLYIKKESKKEIVVAMKKNDFTEFRDVEFAYQVTGVRDGFEGQKIIVDIEKLGTSEIDEELAKNDVQKRIKALAQKMEQRSMKKEAVVNEEKK